MSVSRRVVLTGGLAAAVGAVTGCADPSTNRWRPGSGEPAPGVGAGGPVKPSGRPGESVVVHPPDPPKLTATLSQYLKPTSANPNHPTYAGAVGLVVVDGKVTTQVAVGDALRYKAGPVELPTSQRVKMRADSIFDLASLTKVYTSILLLQQVDKGRIDLAAPVASYLQDFTGAGKAAVTVEMLLTHTSGLPVGAAVTGLPDDAARRRAVQQTPLVKGAVPGNTFRYSSVGLMIAAYLVEQATGLRLDAALKRDLTDPLGLRDTGFNPLTAGWLSTAGRARLVATDARTSRGLLRGTVHDDVANIMGGIAGSAGVFSTAADVAVIGQLLLNGGTHAGKRILSADIVKRMLTNANKGKPAIDPERPHRTADHGLGVVLNQPWFMGRLGGSRSFGHTGFTGTSFVVNPARKLVFVLLTNRAHPNWSWANPDPARVAAANVV
ncbi:serine hydrolase [Asanoa sp. WMMD1127]|uniref:serine hydrolase domain-containing protein n=1 Tax=Asanoa sp. WMMD1127 TaxID=3016107 RepID=UPI002415CEA6|nr:serine hydrolase domain-containing protein [Asanoa sp. WMMD1127]MDG4823418.1 serine hydrolase [Asanoa sp. WMMD1127]